MSIRCLELDIPAVIGVGSKVYAEISNYNSIEINCKQKFYKKLVNEKYSYFSNNK